MTQSERMLSKYDLVCPTADELSHVPDDLTVAQFILDSSHPTRPVRSHEVPWLIDDKTGRKVGFEEVGPIPSLTNFWGIMATCVEFHDENRTPGIDFPRKSRLTCG
jgi:hypothetical protein